VVRCPFCGWNETLVVDSREHGDGESIRRRRRCPHCTRRFTTYERVELALFRIVKKDGRREDFDRAKLRAKLGVALTKRPVSEEQIDALIGGVEQELLQRGDREISSADVGELLMRRLKDLDEIAYIRFASVYRNFQDLDSLRSEMEELTRAREAAPPSNGRDGRDGRDGRTGPDDPDGHGRHD
jgi:transcriptional repressor NrdR